MQEISLSEMLKCGVHFGHRKSKKHPKMGRFVFDVKQGICIIDLEKTKEKLEEALKVVKSLASQNKTILFVGTKRQAVEIVKKYAKDCGMPYMVERWIGGLFTNFSNVTRLSQKLTRLKRDRDTGNLGKYTKKEQLNFQREIEKLEKMVGGIEKMSKLPDAIFVVDMKEEKTAIKEAVRRKVPIIAMADTNVNPDLAQYPIPSNDDAIKSINYIVKAVAETIKENKKEIAPVAAPAK
ncbi:MAG: 30S ribosomal protein S2 [Patescibacteria group bacterium]|jgi:small subunit ribosomal protein S2